MIVNYNACFFRGRLEWSGFYMPIGPDTEGPESYATREPLLDRSRSNPGRQDPLIDPGRRAVKGHLIAKLSPKLGSN